MLRGYGHRGDTYRHGSEHSFPTRLSSYLAFVPEYGEVRTFALESVREISPLADRFTPLEELPDSAFPHSLGVHSGVPERVEVAFQAGVADYVKGREWHPSQQVSDHPDGRVTIALDVCLDRALQGWILSFGPFAKVVAPPALAKTIAEQLGQAHARYAAPGEDVQVS